jgi:hypothetical protein
VDLVEHLKHERPVGVVAASADDDSDGHLWLHIRSAIILHPLPRLACEASETFGLRKRKRSNALILLAMP